MAEKQEKTEGRESTRRGARAAAENASGEMRRSGQTMRHGMHRAGEALGRGMAASGDTARRGFQAAGDASQQIAHATADETEEAADRLADMARQATDDFSMLMRLPGLGGGIEHMQHAMTGVVTHVVQANARAVQELMRAANPGVLVEMQQRFTRHYLDGLIEGSAEILRVSRQFAETALRPIEERSRRRREHGRSGHHRSSGNGDDHTVSEVMTREVELARPDQSVQEVAKRMADLDTGAIPVGEDDRLVGMVTDRDIAVRVTAEGKDPKETRVREIMSEGVRYCFEDEGIEQVAENMAEQQIRRLPVVNRDKRLVGIVSLGDIAAGSPQEVSGAALRGVSQPASGWEAEKQRAYAGDRPGRRGGRLLTRLDKRSLLSVSY